MVQTRLTPSFINDWERTLQYFSVSSKWLYEEDSRFDSQTYAQAGYAAQRIVEGCHFDKLPLGNLVGRVYHPTENQPRSNFKRIWVEIGEGPPYLSGRQIFFFRPDRERFLSQRMLKLHELIVPQGTILLSRSGTTGLPVLVNQWLSSFAVTDDAIRIFPGAAPAGFVYAYLASSIGRPLIVKSEYGSTVSHLEAKHITTIPIPVLPGSWQDEIHEKISHAYALRDEANSLLDQADNKLHSLLGISSFTEGDINYLAGEGKPRAFVVHSSELGARLDAMNHIPVVRSAIVKLERGRFPLVPLSTLCAQITIPARFKRKYVEVDKGVPYLLPSHLPLLRPYGMKALSEKQAKENPEYLLVEDQLLVTTDGTVGRVHPVTRGMAGWFGSNNMARLGDTHTDIGFLYAFLATPFGVHQMRKDIYGGVVDHINEGHIANVLCPDVPRGQQVEIGELVRRAFEKKDEANAIEDEAIEKLERLIRNGRG